MTMKMVMKGHVMLETSCWGGVRQVELILADDPLTTAWDLTMDV